MKRTLYIRITLSSVCLVIVFLFDGCSIFRPIGHAISQGYENSIAYFNGYYNAKSLFNEAEDEVKEDALNKRGQDSAMAAGFQIPATTKEKFVKVIDKCSNILALHSTSTLVDDALILIGKSFYYQAEYTKAERKFSELLTQYPNSPLVLETQIWYAQTEERLKKIEAGIRICESTIIAAKASDDIKIEVQAHGILGKLYLQQKQIDKAVMEFEKEIALSNDDDIKAEAQASLGNIYFSEEQYDKAAQLYLKVGSYTSDPYLNYYSTVQAAIAYRKIGEYKKGLPFVDAMIENFRYQVYLPYLLYERANNYAESGKRAEAIDEYIYVDTMYANSECARQSAYQLGVIFEKEVGDYQLALKYYKEVISTTIPKYAVDGRIKFNALTRYFDAWKRLKNADSLLFVLTDTSKKTIIDTLSEGVSKSDNFTAEVIVADTPAKETSNAAGSRSRRFLPRFVSPAADSLSSVSDSTKRKTGMTATPPIRTNFDSLKTLRSLVDSAQNAVAQASSQESHIGADSIAVLKFIADSMQKNVAFFSTKIADSLKIIKSIAAQDLGDVFYTELVVPDSAMFWYKKSIAWSYNSYQSPRILYILAELSRTNTGEENNTSEEYYLRLDHDFHESIYGKEARRLLGKESFEDKADTAAIYYEQAEKQIDKKQYTNAINTFRSIAQSYPKSPLAAKSDYAIGWVLENNLERPESAKAQYDSVVKNYDGTKYAIESAKRSKALALYDNSKQDTAKTSDAKVNKPVIQKTPADSTKFNSMKVDTIKNKVKLDTIKIEKSDTSQSNAMKIDTSRMKTTKMDSSGIISSPVERRAIIPVGTGKDSVVSRNKIVN